MDDEVKTSGISCVLFLRGIDEMIWDWDLSFVIVNWINGIKINIRILGWSTLRIIQVRHPNGTMCTFLVGNLVR